MPHPVPPLQEARLPWCDAAMRPTIPGQAVRCAPEVGCPPVPTKDMPAEAMGRGYTFPFRPKMLDVWAEGYDLNDLRIDVQSGCVVGVVGLSLSMALGIASEVAPAVGCVWVHHAVVCACLHDQNCFGAGFGFWIRAG